MATGRRDDPGYLDKHFNPRHPYGWRQSRNRKENQRILISIHATHTGGDQTLSDILLYLYISIHATHTGGDLEAKGDELAKKVISIHATHTGGDWTFFTYRLPTTYFNPRHPYGWRRGSRAYGFIRWTFQSTPPIRVATIWSACTYTATRISIHATHTGGDACQHSL